MSNKSKYANLVVKSDEKRLVYGEVYAPMQVDTQNDFATADTIEKMAHGFMSNGRSDKIDVMHTFEESGCHVVESFIARKGDPDGFVEGSWVLGVKITPDDLWMKVKSGELSGFSLAGPLVHEKVQAVVRVTRRMEGMTEASKDGLLPPHNHDLNIEFDSDGNIIEGKTDTELGHSHTIKSATATESTLEHSHRLILIENE